MFKDWMNNESTAKVVIVQLTMNLCFVLVESLFCFGRINCFLLYIYIYMYTIFLCTQKNEYTIESVSVAVRPAVRLHDNFRKETLIDLKFSAEFNRINISVEFEDGSDPSKIS